jgi:hypothetical protein
MKLANLWLFFYNSEFVEPPEPPIPVEVIDRAVGATVKGIPHRRRIVPSPEWVIRLRSFTPASEIGEDSRSDDSVSPARGHVRA